MLVSKNRQRKIRRKEKAYMLAVNKSLAEWIMEQEGHIRDLSAANKKYMVENELLRKQNARASSVIQALVLVK